MMMIIIKIIMTSMTVMIMVIKSNNKNTKCPIDAHFANTSTEENSTLRLKNSSILAFPNSDYFGAKCNFTILSKYIGQFGQIISLEKDILQFLDKYIFCWTNNFWRKTFFLQFWTNTLGQIHWDKYILKVYLKVYLKYILKYFVFCILYFVFCILYILYILYILNIVFCILFFVFCI